MYTENERAPLCGCCDGFGLSTPYCKHRRAEEIIREQRRRLRGIIDTCPKERLEEIEEYLMRPNGQRASEEWRALVEAARFGP